VAIAKMLRFPDLKALGIVNNRVQLGRLIQNHGFPPGRLLGPNTRAWTEIEIQNWVDSRPIVREPDATPREERFGAHKVAAKATKVQTKRSAPKRRPKR
jgi:predicted DNA-binding transcriptional regulator AlpA